MKKNSIKTSFKYGGQSGDININQYWEEKCPRCNSNVRIALSNDIIDWESAYYELMYQMGEVIKEQAEKIKQLQKTK